MGTRDHVRGIDFSNSRIARLGEIRPEGFIRHSEIESVRLHRGVRLRWITPRLALGLILLLPLAAVVIPATMGFLTGAFKGPIHPFTALGLMVLVPLLLTSAYYVFDVVRPRPFLVVRHQNRETWLPFRGDAGRPLEEQIEEIRARILLEDVPGGSAGGDRHESPVH